MQCVTSWCASAAPLCRLLVLLQLRLLGRGLVSKAATTTARSYLLSTIPDLKID